VKSAGTQEYNPSLPSRTWEFRQAGELERITAFSLVCRKNSIAGLFQTAEQTTLYL